MKTWIVGRLHERVEAEDQHAAWNFLRNRPLDDFGLIVCAQPADGTEDDRVCVHTAALLLTWGRDDEARFLLDALRDAGVDSEKADIAYAAQHGRSDLAPARPS